MSGYKLHLSDTQEELVRSFALWNRQFGSTLAWRKKQAHSPGWWDRAAGFCLKENISGSLLIFVVFAYCNSCPEDPEVPFSATTFRSEHLLYRSLANFRKTLGIVLTKFEVCHNIETGLPLVLPVKAGDLARVAARLACLYFEALMEVRTYELMRGKGRIADPVYDAIAYRICEQNPMLLLRVARTPRVRALAAVNAFFLCDQQPWHTFAWEGVASHHSLRMPDQMAGCEVARFYEGGKLRPIWPVNPLQDKLWAEMADPLSHPTLCLSHVPLCERTQMYLDAKWEMIKRDQQPPAGTTPL